MSLSIDRYSVATIRCCGALFGKISHRSGLEPEASETEEDTEDSEDSEKVKEPETSDNDTTKPSIDEGR